MLFILYVSTCFFVCVYICGERGMWLHRGQSCCLPWVFLCLFVWIFCLFVLFLLLFFRGRSLDDSDRLLACQPENLPVSSSPELTSITSITTMPSHGFWVWNSGSHDGTTELYQLSCIFPVFTLKMSIDIHSLYNITGFVVTCIAHTWLYSPFSVLISISDLENQKLRERIEMLYSTTRFCQAGFRNSFSKKELY